MRADGFVLRTDLNRRTGWARFRFTTDATVHLGQLDQRTRSRTGCLRCRVHRGIFFAERVDGGGILIAGFVLFL
jgi:hypothetical protein